LSRPLKEASPARKLAVMESIGGTRLAANRQSGKADNLESQIRFDRDVVELNPDWVSICIGINDVWRQFDSPAIVNAHVLPDEYEMNFEKMILKITGKVKGIFILSPYIMESNREDVMRKRMDEYVAIAKKLAEKYNCIFVDFQKMYEDYCKVRHSSYVAWDRIHPNQIGATLMAREFLNHCDFDYNHKV